MGSTADKVKGATNEAIGKAKQGVGEAVGSDRLEGEGVIQEVKGKGQKAVGDAKEATKDAVNNAAASANKNLRSALVDRQKKDRSFGPVFFISQIDFMAGRDESRRRSPTSPPAVRRRTSASRSAGSRRRRHGRRSQARAE